MYLQLSAQLSVTHGDLKAVDAEQKDVLVELASRWRQANLVKLIV